MAKFPDTLLTGIATLMILLIVGAIFGRLHGKDEAGQVKAIGDRVACGLFALPLVSLSVCLAFPQAHLGWALSAPLPLAAYVVLLASTDIKPNGWLAGHFTGALVVAVGAIYSVMAVGAWRVFA